jgi:hypothetical protein
MFAVHPVHCEAVAGIVGRADLLAATFFILSLLAYQGHAKVRDGKAEAAGGKLFEKVHHYHHQHQNHNHQQQQQQQHQHVLQHQQQQLHHQLLDANGNLLCQKTSKKKAAFGEKSVKSNFELGLCVIFAGCAMFSKEQGVTALGVCFAADAVKLVSQARSVSGLKHDPRLKSLLALAASAVGLLFIRARLMGYSSPTFAKADNPASASDSLLTRTLTFAHLPVFNFMLLLFPTRLSFDWSMNSIELIKDLADGRNFLSVAFYAALFAVAAQTMKRALSRSHATEPETWPLISTSLSIAAPSFLPASNLFFYVGFVVAERVLYIPSVGYCLMSGYAVAHVLRRLRLRRQMVFYRASICLTLILLIGLGLRTVRRNGDWTNEENLYRAGIEINPPKGEPTHLSFLT